MSNTVIKVENLSKSYILKHQNAERYTALRDVIANKVKSLFTQHSALNTQKSEIFWALNDISFEVNQGDRIGIIGRNGAGKSTLLKVLSRIVSPTKGRITIDGRVASLLEVGTGFHPELTGRENIFLNGAILGMSRMEIQKKFDEIVAFSEVERFLDTPVKRYSSGMYVRLAFAVAAHLEPEILIVDEVLAVGDTEFQKKCMGKMKDVSGEGRTVLFVSHNMEAVQKLCNKGILLKSGMLEKVDTIDNVVRSYLDSGGYSQAIYEIPVPLDYEYLNGFVKSVCIENEKCEQVTEIPIGAYWQIRIKFRINKPTDQLVCGIGIQSAYGLPIRTSWSSPEHFETGEYEAIFKNSDIMLAAGQYIIVIGLSNGGRTFHYVDKLVSINISEVSELINNPRIVNTISGLILNPMPVSFNKIG